MLASLAEPELTLRIQKPTRFVTVADFVGISLILGFSLSGADQYLDLLEIYAFVTVVTIRRKKTFAV